MNAVLVIDDERLIRELCRDILTSAGFPVLSAKDALEGLQLVQEKPIGAILLDIMMPKMSGLDALKRFGEVAPEVPVVMVTADSTQKSLINSLRFGAYDFIPKPFDPQDLVHAVRRAMERHRLLKENRELMEALTHKVEELTTLNALYEELAQRLEEKVEEQTAELQKGKTLLESILAHMASGLLVVDPDGRIKTINRYGAGVLRPSPEALLGERLLDHFPDAQELLLVKPDRISKEIELHLSDGTVIPLGFNNSYLLNPRGEREGVIIVFRDLSEIKQLQEEIRKKDRLATIGEVASGIAHEIRNPLFGISSVAQILAREVPFEPVHRELVFAMLAETKRLNTLVEDLLFYGRPPSLSLNPVDLYQIWEEILNLHADQLAEGQITLMKEFDGNLPPLLLDGNKIRQVFLNVLKNAFEATPPGGTITIKTKRQKAKGKRQKEDPDAAPTPTTHHPDVEFVEISVQDTGLGIAPERLERIFELFFTTKASGSGLGLPICRRIIEDHGGSITVTSERGKGSCFTILLPVNVPRSMVEWDET
ncbi:MAG: response regulator [candidate division NC10 bacterium]|nr:response regulator [candidate division NC10 bacterium]